jgi:hypothetical protein
VAATRERLAAQLGCTAASVNLAPLLEALERAGMIRSVDGVPVAHARASTLMEWWRTQLYPRVWDWVYGRVGASSRDRALQDLQALCLS